MEPADEEPERRGTLAMAKAKQAMNNEAVAGVVAVACVLLLYFGSSGTSGLSSDEYFAQALKAKQAGAVGEAIELYRKVNDHNQKKKNEQAYNNVGVLYKTLGKYDLAKEAFTGAITANPKLSNAHWNLATLELDADHFDEALTSFDKVIELNPRDAGGIP